MFVNIFLPCILVCELCEHLCVCEHLSVPHAGLVNLIPLCEHDDCVYVYMFLPFILVCESFPGVHIEFAFFINVGILSFYNSTKGNPCPTLLSRSYNYGQESVVGDGLGYY